MDHIWDRKNLGQLREVCQEVLHLLWREPGLLQLILSLSAEVIAPLGEFHNYEVFIKLYLLQVWAQRGQLELEVSYSILKLRVLDHQRGHLTDEAFDPGEELLRVVYRLWDLLQSSDQTDDVRAADLCNLAASEVEDSLQRVGHNSDWACPFRQEKVVH